MQNKIEASLSAEDRDRKSVNDAAFFVINDLICPIDDTFYAIEDAPSATDDTF